MDNQKLPSAPLPDQSTSSSIPIKPKSKINLFILSAIVIIASIIGVGSYYLGKTSNKQNPQTTTSKSQGCTQEAKLCPDGSSVGRTGPNCEFALCPATTIQPTSIPKKVDSESLKNEILKSSGIEVEKIDISPSDSKLTAFLGHDKDWSRFGIYLYDSSSQSTKIIFEVKESTTGRGGYYLDNSALEFSPSGEAFFVNRTGINIPQFFIVDKNGNILYKGEKDLGHGTWTGGQKLLFITTVAEKPFIFDIATNQKSVSTLPNNIFHLKTNKSGNKIIAFSLPKSALKCESFDLLIYLYPDGSLLKIIPNTSLLTEWLDNNSYRYEAVTDCKKNPEEAMFEYSPITVEKFGRFD